MRSVSLADWILRRVAGREQAASMVGDLVEISQHKGMVWFWFSVFSVVVARGWRPVLGLILATYSGFWISFLLYTESLGSHAKHRSPELWKPVCMTVLAFGISLCWAMVYCALRFGVRNRFVQMAFAVAALCVGLACGWWQPVILGCCIAGLAGIVGISVASREVGRTALALLVVVATCNFIWFSTRYFVTTRTVETLFMILVCETMHRWSMGNHKNDQVLEDGETSPGIS